MVNRPLHHPSLQAISVQGILHALADPIRVAIVRELRKAKDGLNCCEVMERAKIKLPKSSCSQHFHILREAGLLSGERSGVELMNKFRGVEVEKRFPGLIAAILKSYSRHSLKR